MKLRGIKSRLKEMREPILEQMAIEQAFQANCRMTMVTTEDDKEFDKAKKLFNESVGHWEVLKTALVEYDKLAESKWKISPDTLLVVAGNLMGILLILNFEKMDIIRTKAISFVLKGRL